MRYGLAVVRVPTQNSDFQVPAPNVGIMLARSRDREPASAPMVAFDRRVCGRSLPVPGGTLGAFGRGGTLPNGDDFRSDAGKEIQAAVRS